MSIVVVIIITGIIIFCGSYLFYYYYYYSGALLIQSAMGQKILALLMGDHINDGFLQENVGPFCEAPKKKWL